MHFVVDPSEMNVFWVSNSGAARGYQKEPRKCKSMKTIIVISFWRVCILASCYSLQVHKMNCGCVEPRFNELTFSLCNALWIYRFRATAFFLSFFLNGKKLVLLTSFLNSILYPGQNVGLLSCTHLFISALMPRSCAVRIKSNCSNYSACHGSLLLQDSRSEWGDKNLTRICREKFS